LTGLFGADSGTVKILDRDIRAEPVAALAKLGIVFQQSALDPDLTPLQNLIFHGGLHGMSRRDAKEKAVTWLDHFGLQDKFYSPCRQLSGGMKRRVELARALMTNPALLLLDEPTQGLDPKSRHDLIARVFELAHKSDLAVLWATHLVSEIRHADHIIVLDHGKIISQGTADALTAAADSTDLEDAFLRLTSHRHAAEIGDAA
jgi:ABC-2 type transport system ATP-binding protein